MMHWVINPKTRCLRCLSVPCANGAVVRPRAVQAGDDMRTRLEDRVERVMQITAAREMERIEKNMTFLASTGSTAPFIGLFGTVWGIMNAFTAIAQTKNTTLAVVAPGIAEALFANCFGVGCCDSCCGCLQQNFT